MPTEPAFTPGPWFADGEHICGNGTEIDVDGYTVAVMHHMFSMGRFAENIRKDESVANARLVAAAPELFEKLRQIEAWIIRLAEQAECGAQKNNRFPALFDAYTADAKNYRATTADIRKVLAKAEGR